MSNDISGGIRSLAAPITDSSDKETKLRAKAEQLEATFLSEMLGYAGVGAMQGSFGGGIGEEQFTSFLRESYAQKMSERGGIGLAETIFQAMTKGGARA